MNERRRSPRQKAPERRRLRTSSVPQSVTDILSRDGNLIVANIMMSALREIAIRDLNLEYDHSECKNGCRHTEQMQNDAHDVRKLMIKMLATGYNELLQSGADHGHMAMLSERSVAGLIMDAQKEWESNRKRYMQRKTKV